MTDPAQSGRNENQMNRRLSMIMEMGEILLTSGAAVSRDEDTISRLCCAYGFTRADVFTITSSIVVTASTPEGEAYTQTRRIRERGTDLGKVEKITALSRRICAAPLELSELEHEIAEIRSAKGTPQSLQFVMYVVISFALSVFFGGSWADGAASALSGAILFAALCACTALKLNDIIVTMLCSAATARFPRRSTPTANTSPKRDTNGLNDGIIASSPASIPADGASETIGNTVFTAAAARPNKA